MRSSVVVPVVIFIFFLVPALFFAGFWFVVQIIEGSWSFLLTPDAGGIAWWAHIGGFICGAYLVRRLDPGRPPAPILTGHWHHCSGRTSPLVVSLGGTRPSPSIP